MLGLIEDFPPGADRIDDPKRLTTADGQKPLGVAGRIVVLKSHGIGRTREQRKKGIKCTDSHGQVKGRATEARLSKECQKWSSSNH